jgi:hypothetical protein
MCAKTHMEVIGSILSVAVDEILTPLYQIAVCFCIIIACFILVTLLKQNVKL